MSMQIIREQESGTFNGQTCAHNGYYAGDFWEEGTTDTTLT